MNLLFYASGPRTYPTSDSSLTHLFHCRTSGRRSFTHGCTRASTTGYTTLDAMIEIGTTTATVCVMSEWILDIFNHKYNLRYSH